MSDHFIRIIPVDARFVPTKEAQEAAVSAVKAAAPGAADVSSESGPQIAFRDCGGNFECVRCPGCPKEIPTETWAGWMDADYAPDVGFRLEPFTLPCCGGSATLDELSYHWPQGFSRYELRAMNMDVGPELPAGLLTNLEELLGCRLRLVRQHL